MRPASLTRRVLLSVALSVAAIALIFVLTGSTKTVTALRQLQPSYIALLLLLAGAEVFLDGARLTLLIRAADGHITLWGGCRLAAISVFGNLLTPFSTGGHVAVVYLLRQQRVPSGRGTSVVITRLLASGVFVLFGALLSLLFLGHLVSDVMAIRTMLLVTGVVFLGLSSLGVAALLNPRVLAALGALVGVVLHRAGVVRRRGYFQNRVNRHVIHARNSFRRFFSTRAEMLGGALVCSWLLYATQVMVFWAVLGALSLGTSLGEGVALSALLIFLLSFVPTPGGAGLGEALFVLVYSSAVPTHLLGVAVLLWRLFYQYLPAALGGVLATAYPASLFSPGVDATSLEEGQRRGVGGRV